MQPQTSPETARFNYLICVLTLLCLIIVNTTTLNAQWSIIPSPVSSNLNTVKTRPAGEIWIGAANSIVHSTDSGATFINYPVIVPGVISNTGIINRLHITDSGNVYMTGYKSLLNGAVILKNTAPNLNWTVAYDSTMGETGNEYQNIVFKNDSIGVAVGFFSVITTTNNAGSSWATSNGYSLIYDIGHLDSNTFLAVGNNAFYHTFSNGNYWTYISFSQTIHRIATSSSNVCYIIGSNYLGKSTNLGSSFNQVTNCPDSNLTAIYCVSADTVLLASTNDIYITYNGGTNWYKFKMNNYRTVREFHFSDSATGYAVGDSGYIIKTNNLAGYPYPIAGFTLPPGLICQGSTPTFTNTSSPLSTYKWFIDGVQVSTALNLIAPPLSAGSHDITLVADYFGNKDTIIRTIAVTAPPTVTPFSANGSTTCTGATAQIFVTPALTGSFYNLYYQGASIQSLQGNGSTLTFTTINLSANTNFEIRGTLYNGCFTDTLIVPVSVYVQQYPANHQFELYRDTVCSNDTTTAIIYNSEPGWLYKIASGPEVAGTGGTIVLPVGPYTGGSSNNYNIIVTAGNDSIINCSHSVPGNGVLHYHGSSITITPVLPVVSVNNYLSFTYTGTGYDNYYWDFGPNAIPTNFTGQTPPPIQFTQQGIDTITLTSYYLNTCAVQTFKYVNVYDTIGSVPVDTCHFSSTTVSFTDHPVNARLSFHNEFNFFYNDNGPYNNQAWEVKTALFNPDYVRTGVDRLSGVVAQPSSRFTANASGSTTDKQGNIYVNVNQANASFFTVANRYMPSVSHYVYHPNIIAKFALGSNVDWIIKADSLIFSDIITTYDGRIFVVGTGCWNGALIQEGLGGVFTYNRTPYVAGDAFIMEINAKGRILNFTPFGVKTNAAGSIRNKSGINSDFIAFPGTPDVDTCAMNLRIEETTNGELLIYGLIQTPDLNDIIEFGQVALNHQLGFYTSTNKKTAFYTRYIPDTGFTEAKSVFAGDLIRVQGFAQDNSGNVYMSGITTKQLITQLGAVTLPTQNDQYGCLVKSDSSITHWRTFSRNLRITSLGFLSDQTLLAGFLGGSGALIHDAHLKPYQVALFGSTRFDTLGNILSCNPNGFYLFRLDACKNVHAYGSTFGSYSFNGTCGQPCHFANAPASIDLGLEKLMINDTSFSAGPVRDIILKIRNRAMLPVDSAEIMFQVNNDAIQSYFYNGNLLYYDTITFVLSTYNFNSRNFNQIKVWIQSVNGSPDDDQKNDTLYFKQVVCNGPLSGTYSIGPDTCYFTNLSDAAGTLKLCGMNGPVKLEIEPGVYYDHAWFATIPGGSASDSLWITSRTGDNTSVTLDHLIKSSSTNFTGPLRIGHKFTSVSNLTFKNTILSLNGLPATLPDNGMLWIDYVKSAIINITNCRFVNSGFNNIRVLNNEALRINMNPNVPQTDSSIVRIINNYFESQATAIEFQADSGITELTIAGNQFNYTLMRGLVNVKNQFGKSYIGGNRFSRIKLYPPNPNSNSLSQSYLNIQYCRDFTVVNNIFESEIQPSSSGTLLNISSNDCTTSCLVANNMIGNHYIPGSGGTGSALKVATSNNINVIHNSIMSGLELQNTSNINIYNNIIKHNKTYNVVDDELTNNYNYNNYIIDSLTNPFWQGTTTSNVKHTFQSWQTTYDRDTNSMTIPVTFSSLTDLHLLDSPTIPGTPWPGITIDIDNETRSSVSPTIGADEFSPLDSLSTVRPGDTDSSGVVDNYDLLPIGYYMGTYGHSRNQIAIDWQDKISKLWPAPNQSSGINRNHADANGDGWVDLSDVSAIASNYGLNYRLMNPEKLSSQSGHPELYLVPNKFTYVPGESVHIDVMLGTNTEPISEFRGIGFQLNINPTYIKQGTYSLQFGDNYICRFADCADFVRTSDFSGIAAGSLVKTDGIQAYGYGRIAELNFVIDDFVTTSAVIPILFLNYKGIDSNGDEMLLSVINDTIQVIVSSVFTTIPVSQPLIVYPNPAMNELNVILPHSCSKPVMIEISDLSGRNIRRNQIIPEENSNTLKFDIHSLNAGVYIIKVITDENRWTARFVKL